MKTWNASRFFETLTLTNRLAEENGFAYHRVSGLEGFEEALHTILNDTAFVAVSDTSDGYMELHETPHTRTVKTVFLAVRHAEGDMPARQECFTLMREVFRQFMSVLILEKTRLEQECIYIDPRITFTEIDRHFFGGAACGYFQIAADTYTDLVYRPGEWTEE